MKKTNIIKACATFAIAGAMAFALAGCGGGSASSSAASSAASSASKSAASSASSAATTSASGSAAASLPGAEIGQPNGWKVDVVTPDKDVVLTNSSNSTQMIEVKYNMASYGTAEKHISLDAENAEKEMKTTTINGNTWYYYEGYSGLIMAVDLSDGSLLVTADGVTLDEATPVLELIKISK